MDKEWATPFKALGWSLQETFRHEAQQMPAYMKMSLKLYFAPVTGLCTGRPIGYLKDVWAEDDALRRASDEALAAKLAKNPYKPEI